MVKIVLSIVVVGALIALAFAFRGESEGTASPSDAVLKNTSANSFAPAEFNEKIADESVVIIDVRTPAEFESGYIEGAVNLDFYSPDFLTELEKLDKGKSYAIYCRTGSRSGQALLMMKNGGFTNAFELKGGVVAWLSGNLALCSAEKVCLR